MINLLRAKFGFSYQDLMALLDALLVGRRRVHFINAVMYLLSDLVTEEKFVGKSTGYFVGAVAHGLYDMGEVDDKDEYMAWGSYSTKGVEE
jgi:hypothetical protein